MVPMRITLAGWSMLSSPPSAPASSATSGVTTSGRSSSRGSAGPESSFTSSSGPVMPQFYPMPPVGTEVARSGPLPVMASFYPVGGGGGGQSATWVRTGTSISAAVSEPCRPLRVSGVLSSGWAKAQPPWATKATSPSRDRA